jgi:hypothetical protein
MSRAPGSMPAARGTRGRPCPGVLARVSNGEVPDRVLERLRPGPRPRERLAAARPLLSAEGGPALGLSQGNGRAVWIRGFAPHASAWRANPLGWGLWAGKGTLTWGSSGDEAVTALPAAEPGRGPKLCGTARGSRPACLHGNAPGPPGPPPRGCAGWGCGRQQRVKGRLTDHPLPPLASGARKRTGAPPGGGKRGPAHPTGPGPPWARCWVVRPRGAGHSSPAAAIISPQGAAQGPRRRRVADLKTAATPSPAPAQARRACPHAHNVSWPARGRRLKGRSFRGWGAWRLVVSASTARGPGGFMTSACRRIVPLMNPPGQRACAGAWCRLRRRSPPRRPRASA